MYEAFKLRRCLRFWSDIDLFLFYVKNQIVFQTNITEIDTLEKNYWYCKCKLLIASLAVFLRLPAQKDTVHDAFKRIYY